jgi:hypothetical protein
VAHQPIDPLFGRLDGEKTQNGNGKAYQWQDKYKQFQINGEYNFHPAKLPIDKNGKT